MRRTVLRRYVSALGGVPSRSFSRLLLHARVQHCGGGPGYLRQVGPSRTGINLQTTAGPDRRERQRGRHDNAYADVVFVSLFPRYTELGYNQAQSFTCTGNLNANVITLSGRAMATRVWER